MDATDVRAPQLWRRPHAKIYGYNQDFSANYYSVTGTFKYFSLIVGDQNCNLPVIAANAELCSN